MLIGYALCGSFCCFSASLHELEGLTAVHDVLPIMSPAAYSTDTRFGAASSIRERIEALSGRGIISSIVEAEPLGPKIKLDLLIISPCTGNTLAKLASGITDTSVTMAAKAHLRSDRPLLIALASNDAMSANLKNISALLMRKNVYFVPMKQDDPISKPHSLIADFTRLPEAIDAALAAKQLRPLFL